MKYIFFMPHADYDDKTGAVLPSEHARLQQAASHLKDYDFGNLLVLGYPTSWIRQTIETLSEQLQCMAGYSLTLDLSYTISRDVSSRNVLSEMLRKREERWADSLLLVGKASSLRPIAEAALARLLPDVPYPAAAKFFSRNSLMAIDIQNRKVLFFRRYS